MSLLTSEVPYTKPQRLRRWIAAAVILAAALAFTVWAAEDCIRTQSGYVASYSYGEMLILSILICFIGILSLIYWRTRTTGAALIAAGLLMYPLFLGYIGVMKKLDRVAWMHEPIVHFGPDQSASLVIYYRPGTTDAQIEDFIENKLEQPAAPRHDGKDFPEFVGSYSRLLTSQANGYEASSLTLRGNETAPQVLSYVSMIQSDPRVQRVFRNLAPDSIHLPPGEQAASTKPPR
jgi:hypothetical protein